MLTSLALRCQGELLRTGRMAALKERVPQAPLPPPLLQQLCAEVDTAQRLHALLALLEHAVAFLSALGTAAHAETPLRAYAAQVLLLTPEAWAAAATPGVEQHVRLCHLQVQPTLDPLLIRARCPLTSA